MTKFAAHEAARDNQAAVIQSLLDQDPKVAVLKDEDARTPLHWACSMNHEHIVKILLPYIKGDIDELVDDSGWTPVHIACAVGNEAVLGLLMAHDPKPGIDLQTGTGATCLHLATSKSHVDLVKSLLEVYKCSVRTKDKKGYTALHRAASVGNQPIIRMLVEAKANINAKDNDGWTPLHHALAEGLGDVGVLLTQLGADATVENAAGETPAQVANTDSVRKYFQQQAAV